MGSLKKNMHLLSHSFYGSGNSLAVSSALGSLIAAISLLSSIKSKLRVWTGEGPTIVCGYWQNSLLGTIGFVASVSR